MSAHSSANKVKNSSHVILQQRRVKETKAALKGKALQFNVDDLVMVAAWGNAAHVKLGSKICPGWQGPYEVVELCRQRHIKCGCWCVGSIPLKLRYPCPSCLFS